MKTKIVNSGDRKDGSIIEFYIKWQQKRTEIVFISKKQNPLTGDYERICQQFITKYLLRSILLYDRKIVKWSAKNAAWNGFLP